MQGLRPAGAGGAQTLRRPRELYDEVSMNWEVTAYDIDGEVLDSWVLENRTLDEATHEAEAEIDLRLPDTDDWTMRRV